jgi:hypothetical protein
LTCAACFISLQTVGISLACPLQTLPQWILHHDTQKTRSLSGSISGLCVAVAAAALLVLCGHFSSLFFTYPCAAAFASSSFCSSSLSFSSIT